MKRVIGICTLHDDPKLGVLTQSRPLGAVTFLGRYAPVDFVLSNFSNSHIDRVYVLVKENMIPIRNHIGNGAIWMNNTKTCSLNLLLNEEGLKNPKLNSDINNMRKNIPLDVMDFDLAVIAPSFVAASIDYRPLIEEHIKSGKHISIVYSQVKNNGDEYKNCDSLKVSCNKVVSVKTNNVKDETFFMSLESVILDRDTLKSIIDKGNPENFRDVLKEKINKNKVDVNAIELDAFFVPIMDLKHYIDYSFQLLDNSIRKKLFKEDWPIYTTTHNTPPALYTRTADVKNSFIANGSIIKGKVRNSIISRDVIIEEGASVNNSIIFTKSEIGKNAKVDYAVTDKQVHIKNGKKVSGKSDKYVYLHFGEEI